MDDGSWIAIAPTCCSHPSLHITPNPKCSFLNVYPEKIIASLLSPRACVCPLSSTTSRRIEITIISKLLLLIDHTRPKECIRQENTHPQSRSHSQLFCFNCKLQSYIDRNLSSKCYLYYHDKRNFTPSPS